MFRSVRENTFNAMYNYYKNRKKLFEKYIKKNVGELELNQESLLHAFGYNVNAIEGLTEKFRHNI